MVKHKAPKAIIIPQPTTHPHYGRTGGELIDLRLPRAAALARRVAGLMGLLIDSVPLACDGDRSLVTLAASLITDPELDIDSRRCLPAPAARRTAGLTGRPLPPAPPAPPPPLGEVSCRAPPTFRVSPLRVVTRSGAPLPGAKPPVGEEPDDTTWAGLPAESDAGLLLRRWAFTRSTCFRRLPSRRRKEALREGCRWMLGRELPAGAVEAACRLRIRTGGTLCEPLAARAASAAASSSAVRGCSRRGAGLPRALRWLGESLRLPEKPKGALPPPLLRELTESTDAAWRARVTTVGPVSVTSATVRVL